MGRSRHSVANTKHEPAVGEIVDAACGSVARKETEEMARPLELLCGVSRRTGP